MSAGFRVWPWIPWALALVALLSFTPGRLSGPIAPGEAETRRVVVGAPAVGLVKELLVAPGATVAVDTVIARLEAPALARELLAARLEQQRLALEVPARRVSLDEDERAATERLEREAAEAKLAVTRVEAELERDRAQLAQLDTQIAKQRELVEKKLASSAGLDDLVLRRASLKETVDQGRAVVDTARRVYEAAERARAERRRGRPAAAADDERLRPLDAAVKAQEERVRVLEAQVAALAVRATSSGIVLALLVSEGDAVDEGAPLVALVDASPRRVTVYADEVWARDVEVGNRALLAPSDGRGEPFRGAVVALSAAITETPPRFRLIPTEPSFGRAIYVVVDDDAPALLPGQAFDVSFAAEAK